ncbi:Aa_trans domain-containing protein [Cephalotus follicularis]|uniref:Aa_trans domain-containing protein n=1 Tax=Cephalotus follicularis TaxID=3775 RepID=A0A1Q3CF35_CEPFO|nr:Aa_trans domain-containing protein [Cephalotus follicularis]
MGDMYPIEELPTNETNTAVSPQPLLANIVNSSTREATSITNKEFIGRGSHRHVEPEFIVRAGSGSSSRRQVDRESQTGSSRRHVEPEFIGRTGSGNSSRHQVDRESRTGSSRHEVDPESRIGSSRHRVESGLSGWLGGSRNRVEPDPGFDIWIGGSRHGVEPEFNGSIHGSSHRVEPEHNGSVGGSSRGFDLSQLENWLPCTESRNGNIYFAIFQLLNSGIGPQSLTLPVAFATLGWAWGIVCLTLAFAWQLYTIWLLVELHESVPPGVRYSRYVQLAVAAFGPSLGRWLTIFPTMYLSGGAVSLLVINGGTGLKQFYKILCGGNHSCLSHSPSAVEWYLVFTFICVVVAEFLPNLNSIAWVSLVGAITGIMVDTMLWTMPIQKGRPDPVSYKSAHPAHSDMARFGFAFNAIGILVLAYRGHNVILEIQGTLPSTPEHPTKKPMWRAVITSYAIIAMCFYPVAIAGFWAYGNKIPQIGGLLKAYMEIHGPSTSKLRLTILYIIVLINYVCNFQIYAILAFDNVEFRYTLMRKKRVTKRVRFLIKVFYGSFAYFIGVTFPFFPKLSPFMGGLTLNVAYAYPCFMWILIFKPSRFSVMWWINMILGSIGVILGVLLVVSALWKLIDFGMDANFFHPH